MEVEALGLDSLGPVGPRVGTQALQGWNQLAEPCAVPPNPPWEVPWAPELEELPDDRDTPDEEDDEDDPPQK